VKLAEVFLTTPKHGPMRTWRRCLDNRSNDLDFRKDHDKAGTGLDKAIQMVLRGHTADVQKIFDHLVLDRIMVCLDNDLDYSVLGIFVELQNTTCEGPDDGLAKMDPSASSFDQGIR
jgi:hypothetical protein